MPELKEYLRIFGVSIVDFLYPKICIVSGKRLPENNSNSFIDDTVLSALEKPDSSEFRDFKAALNTEYFYSSFVFRHDNEMQTLIHFLKYKGFTTLGEFLGEKAGIEILRKDNDALRGFHYLLPVPLYHSKLRERGYNQSLHICRGLNKALNLELIEKDIIRTRNTKSQTGLSYDERVANVRDAFTLSEESVSMLAGKGIIIVDDVLTTGSTVKEVVRTIKRETGAKTGVITLAIAKS